MLSDLADKILCDEIQFMLISSRHICISSIYYMKRNWKEAKKEARKERKEKQASSQNKMFKLDIPT